MKQITILMIVAAAAAALVSCTKEKELVPAQEGIQVTIVAGMPQTEPTTKTELNNDPGAKNKVEWTAGDRVGFITGQDDAINVQSEAASITGGLASFTGEVPAAGDYYAYYPFSNDTDAGYHYNGGTPYIKISNEQHPTLTSFDKNADVLVSEAFEVDAAGNKTVDNLKFRRRVAFIKIYFVDGTTGGKLSGQYATQVAIQGDNRINGRVNLFGDTFLDSGWKKTTAFYDANTFQIIGNYAYFSIIPEAVTAGSNLIITADTKNYSISRTIQFPATYSISAGQMQPIKVTLTDADVTEKPKSLVVNKLWSKMSTSSAAWTTTLSASGKTGSAGSDMNIAIDDQYVYVAEFGGSKNIWAIDINDASNVKLVNTSTVESVGFDGSVYLSCVRVVKKNDGTPVLIASNLFQDGDSNSTGRLYIWDDGIDNAPRVVTLQQWGAGRRLGDTFTTYGNYEDCWLLFGTQTGNGFVTFKLPTGNSSSLISRIAFDCTDFCSYYPFPGELTRGMFGWRGGNHDDGTLYRNRLMTIASTEEAIKTEGAHTASIDKLTEWMANSENNNGIGFNYTEFGGKRYVIWCMNSTTGTQFELLVKSANTDVDWATIINTQGPAFSEMLTGGMSTTWKMSADCQIWNTGTEVYIAINKINVGLAVYKMTLE